MLLRTDRSVWLFFFFVVFRYVFGYQKNSNIQAKGVRLNGEKITHVVSSTVTTGLLQSLLRDRLCPEPCKEEIEIQVKVGLLAPGSFFPFDLPQAFLNSAGCSQAFPRAGFL